MPKYLIFISQRILLQKSEYGSLRIIYLYFPLLLFFFDIITYMLVTPLCVIEENHIHFLRLLLKVFFFMYLLSCRILLFFSSYMHNFYTHNLIKHSFGQLCHYY